MAAEVVYSEQRARLLRLTLRVVMVLVAVMVAAGVWAVVGIATGEDPEVQARGILVAIVLGLQSTVLLGATLRSLRLLPGRGPSARFWCSLTGGLTMLASLPLVTNLIGLLVVFVGIFLLTLALRTDPVERAA